MKSHLNQNLLIHLMSSKPIRIILDSHQGELYNLAPMLFFWIQEKKFTSTNLEIIYVGHQMTNSQIESGLQFLKGRIDFSLVNFEFVSNRKNLLQKIISFLSFLLYIFVNPKAWITLVPYDQKRIFYFFVNFASLKLIAFSHTSGYETYSKGFYHQKNLRYSKDFPILIKSKEGKEYANALGYSKYIISGNYNNLEAYQNHITKNIQSKNDICIFSYGKQDKMFKDQSWEETHLEIFRALQNCCIEEISIKLHPSQNRSDIFELIDKNNLNININFLEGNPILAAYSFERFIAVLTSAGHHAIDLNKPVCCYASSKMRDEVRAFGNDPYPYSQFNAEEISSQKKLEDWLKIIRPANNLKRIHNDESFLNFEELCKKL
tara:strand:+ start:22537 stop:23667 length:1131 start_codon:yes stop_codon:yes gene_type:complete